MARCFVTRELPGAAVDRLRAEHHVEVWSEGTPVPPERLEAEARDADALLLMLSDRLGGDLIAAAPRAARDRQLRGGHRQRRPRRRHGRAASRWGTRPTC